MDVPIADDFVAGTGMNVAGEEHACIIAYPEQVRSANVQKRWNWFNEGDQHAEAGEPSLIAGITRQVMSDYAIDPRRVFVAGLSAGGVAAAVMGAAYPELYAAVGVHSGLAVGVARDVGSAMAAMRSGRAAARRSGVHGLLVVPAIVFLGDQDNVVNPLNADQIVAQAAGDMALTMQAKKGISGGRAYTRALFVDGAGTAGSSNGPFTGAPCRSGGSPKGSFTDPMGPNATREMLRFFLEHRKPI